MGLLFLHNACELAGENDILPQVGTNTPLLMVEWRRNVNWTQDRMRVVDLGMHLTIS